MRERLGAIIGRPPRAAGSAPSTRSPPGSCAAMPRLVGLKSNFTILDTDDQLRLLKQLIAPRISTSKRWPARALLARHRALEGPRARPGQGAAGEGGGFANGRAVELYRAVSGAARDLNACDFGDLLLHNLTLFTDHPDVLGELSAALPLHPGRRVPGHQRRAISVAAAAGPGPAQPLLRRRRRPVDLRLARRARSTTSCASRAIFPARRSSGWSENYRSTPAYPRRRLRADRAQRGRLGKTLWTDAEEGEKVAVRGVWDGEEEARWVGDEIEALQRKGHALREIAILVRAGFQIREFEERFITLAPALSRDRRPALLRAPGDPRRARLSAADPVSRPTTSPSSASSTRRGAASATPRLQLLHGAGAGRRVAAGRGGARSWSPADELPPGRAQRARRTSSPMLDRWRAEAAAQPACRAGAERARRDAAIPACGRPTDRPTRRAGWKTSRSWSSRWPSSRTWPAFSSTSAW